MPLFDVISIALVMVLECYDCDERSGVCRVYVKNETNVYELNQKSADKQQEKIRVMIFEGLRADALLVMKTLSVTSRPLYRWKAEDLSFLYVLLVWGVKLVSS
jgi:hypothetical protein